MDTDVEGLQVAQTRSPVPVSSVFFEIGFYMSTSRSLLPPIVACLASSIICWIPTALSSVPPMGDLGAHLALAVAIRHLFDGGHPLSSEFAFGTFPAPNSAFYLLIQPLMAFLSPIAATKAVLLLCYFLPGAFAGGALARASGRSFFCGALIPPLLLTSQYLNGFVDFLFAVPTLLALLAALEHYRQKGELWRIWWGGPVAFLVHIHAWMLLTGIAVVVSLFDKAPALARVRNAFGVSLGGVAFVIIWRLLVSTDAAQAEAVRWGPDFAARLSALPESTIFVLPSRLDDFLAATILVVVFTMRRVSGPVSNTSTLTLRVSAAVTWLAYMLLPDGLGAYVELYQRNAVFALVLATLLACPDGLLPGSPRAGTLRPVLVWAFGAFMVVPAIAASVAWGHHVSQFSAEAKGLPAVLRCAPSRSRLFFYPTSLPQSRGFGRFLYRHAGQYHTALNQGPTSFSFAWLPGRVIQQRDLGFDFEFASHDLVLDRSRTDRYQAALVYSPSGPAVQVPGYAIACTDGAWSLAIRRPDSTK